MRIYSGFSPPGFHTETRAACSRLGVAAWVCARVFSWMTKKSPRHRRAWEGRGQTATLPSLGDVPPLALIRRLCRAKGRIKLAPITSKTPSARTFSFPLSSSTRSCSRNTPTLLTPAHPIGKRSPPLGCAATILHYENIHLQLTYRRSWSRDNYIVVFAE